MFIRNSAPGAPNQIQAFWSYHRANKALILIQHTHPTSRCTSTTCLQSLRTSPTHSCYVLPQFVSALTEVLTLTFYDSMSPFPLWATDCMYLSVSLSNVRMLQQVYLYTQPAVHLLRKLQEKMNDANSSARERAKTLTLAPCLNLSFVICYRMSITPVQMVHINPCKSLKSRLTY